MLNSLQVADQCVSKISGIRPKSSAYVLAVGFICKRNYINVVLKNEKHTCLHAQWGPLAIMRRAEGENISTPFVFLFLLGGS